jgi:hypothetical protein
MRLTRLFFGLVLLAVSLVSGQRPELMTQAAASARPSFDPRGVVRQMQSVHVDTPTAGSDEGEFLGVCRRTSAARNEMAVSSSNSYGHPTFPRL